MTLPSSGTITLDEIIAEFNGTYNANGSNLLLYYRGGNWVPNSSNNTNIPTSGTITIKDFYGASHIANLKMIAGQSGAFSGYSAGSPYGSLTPNKYTGCTIINIDTYFNGTNYTLVLGMQGPPIPATQQPFTNIIFTVGSLQSFSAASASYSVSGNVATWSWTTGANILFTSGSTYYITLA